MLTFKTQKELDTLLLYLKPYIKNLPEFKSLLLRNTKIENDSAFEEKLDNLQNELAELEEVKDDLTVKLCFLRRDLCDDLAREYASESIKEKLKINNFNTEVKRLCIDLAFEKEQTINKKDEFIVEIRKIIEIFEGEFVKKKYNRNDVYQTAEAYFKQL
ncbi:hypothetical protein COBT_000862 [Conglomerata obtusa]